MEKLLNDISVVLLIAMGFIVISFFVFLIRHAHENKKIHKATSDEN
jgi:hypothetical protein